MANMSYCRFQNTVIDLKDCYENMDDDELSDDEKKAKERLIDLCVDIALDFGAGINREVEEIEDSYQY